MTFSPAREPLINDWITSVSDSGVYTALAANKLTGYQVAKGCLGNVEASTPEELVRLCRSQDVLRVLVAHAEQARETAAAGLPGRGDPAAAHQP